MALLEVVLGDVVGSGLRGVGDSSALHARLVRSLLSMLASGNGRWLTGLLGHLRHGGLADAVASWVSMGENQPVTGQQLRVALPADVLADLAVLSDIDPDEVADGLAQVLPSVVDQLSPSGVLPSECGLRSALGGLSRMLSGSGWAPVD